MVRNFEDKVAGLEAAYEKKLGEVQQQLDASLRRSEDMAQGLEIKNTLIERLEEEVARLQSLHAKAEKREIPVQTRMAATQVATSPADVVEKYGTPVVTDKAQRASSLQTPNPLFGRGSVSPSRSQSHSPTASEGSVATVSSMSMSMSPAKLASPAAILDKKQSAVKMSRHATPNKERPAQTP